MHTPTAAERPTIVFKNEWREVFDGRVPEDWTPTLSVSVVIASYNSATLPLTLASLAAQDYPEDLLEVVVVDDGSDPSVELGSIVPKNLKLIRVEEGWGRSNATDIGIKATTGDIIYWVDADMILFRDNVRQHAKWGHFIPEAATIGDKGFIESWDYTPESVFEKVSDGTIGSDHDRSELHEHWSIQIFRDTDDLNTSHGRNYSTHMGACASVTRRVYDRTFGQDTRLHLGEDTEIAYQLWQAGAVFIPVHEALTWHLGRGTVQDHAAKVAWHNDVHFAQRMPIPRYRRTSDNRIWEVPLVKAVVEVDVDTAVFARNCVDRLLNSTMTDLHVVLVGPWSELHEGRRKMLADPLNELYLVREWFRSDNRVIFAETVPDSVFPSPYRLDVPVTAGVTSDSVRQMYIQIDQPRLGAVRYFTPGHDKNSSVTIWDSAIRARVTPYLAHGAVLEDLVDQAAGFEWGSAIRAGLVDLRTEDLTERVECVDPEVAELRERVQQLEADLAAAGRVSFKRRIARRVNRALGGRPGNIYRRLRRNG